MKHWALVIEWQTPDDADHHAAMTSIVDKFHQANELPAERVTAYAGVSAELIAQAAETGAIVEQASRLQLAPGDVVTIRPAPDLRDYTAQEFHEYCQVAKAAFPGHQVVVLERDATIEAGPAGESTDEPEETS
ncbi:hypothetical protein [Amycolatopsis sp. NPDC004378]